MVFDEELLTRRLSELDPAGLRLFAAACAEQLYEDYVLHAAASGQGSPQRVRSCLDAVWANVRDGGGAELRSCLQDVEELVPDVEDENWVPTSGAAQNALTALAFALECALEPDTKLAVSAAYQVYESADAAALREIEGDVVTVEMEQTVLAHPQVQAALGAQSRLLDRICGTLKADLDRLTREVRQDTTRDISG